MSITITDVITHDVRFPTSRQSDGSDAMYQADYSAAYVVLKTDSSEGFEGHGLSFTMGRGTEVCISAINALKGYVQGQTLETITEDMGAFWRRMTSDGQLRWLGPEKGVIHLATSALVNAVWDLYAKVNKKPLWKLLVDMEPEEVIRCIDFRYVTDFLTPEEALVILHNNRETRNIREEKLLKEGFPAYITSTGWLGYSDEKTRQLSEKAKNEGWTYFKMKVGRDIKDDMRRAGIIRDVIGRDCKLMMDANQVWDVGEAISNIKQLSEFDPWWIEEPTSPDDVLGHAAIAKAINPIRVATGETCQNRILFKQFMEANAIDVCQIDACRLGGVNEVICVLLMAAKHKIPVCPHAGGVGLCEYVQHLAYFDYICVSNSLEDRVIEYVDHLHEYFRDPVKIKDGCYMPALEPGYSITMKPEAFEEFEFPEGTAWR